MSSGLILLDEPATKRLIKAIESDLDLLVHLGDWLLHLNMFSDAQIYDILRFIHIQKTQISVHSDFRRS